MQKSSEHTGRRMTDAQERAFDSGNYLAAWLINYDNQPNTRLACRSVFENSARSGEEPKNQTHQR